MHLFISSLWSTHRPDGLYHLIFHLSVWPFSGLVVELDPPPIKYIPLLERLYFRPGIFCFKILVVQQLVYSLSLASRPCPVWKISPGIFSVLEGPI